MWYTMAKLAQKACPLWWSLSGERLCHHLGFLFISLCSFHLFGHITVIENQRSQLEQVIHRGLRTIGSLLNFVSNGWSRVHYAMYTQKGLSLR